MATLTDRTGPLTPRTASSVRRTTAQLSPALTILVTVLFAIGVIAGWFSYLDRSPVRRDFVPGSSAWWQHLAVALAAVAILAYAQCRHQQRFGRWSRRLWLLAPVGKPAARRVARTAAAPFRGHGGIGRMLLALPPATLFAYCFFRCGLQVIGGLDPNSTVNAWGGPTYPGAMACHYLDGFLLMGAAAWLLDRILLPDPARNAAQVAQEDA